MILIEKISEREREGGREKEKERGKERKKEERECVCNFIYALITNKSTVNLI